MQSCLCSHDRDELQRFLSRDPLLNAYTLGDLDPFFWDRTVWFVSSHDDAIDEVALLYVGLDLPTLVAMTNTSHATMAGLMSSLVPLLPRRFHAHLSPGLEGALGEHWDATAHGTHLKMGLVEPTAVDGRDTTDAQRLGPADLDDLRSLYRTAYPANWFDPRMLATGKYFGIRRQGHLVCVAGIHVYSAQTRVAALGNVTTHPEFRHQGLASTATAALCLDLQGSVDSIGLNVRDDNRDAIGLYRSLGFREVAPYGEFFFESITPAVGSTMAPG